MRTVLRQCPTPLDPGRNDLFHRQVPGEYIAQVFAVMAVASRRTLQVLTKRHGRMRSLLSDGSWRRRVAAETARLHPG